MICTDVSAPTYLIFSDSVPALLYYSHIPTLILAFTFSIFIISKKRTWCEVSIFILTLVFAFCVVFNLILWTSVQPDWITFLFSTYGILSPAIFMLSVLFVHAFIEKGKVGFRALLFFLVPLLPLVFFTHLHIEKFDLVNCEAHENRGWYYYYFYGYEFLISLWILIYGTYKYRTEKKTDFRKQILLLLVGIEFFLLSFFVTGFLASYLTEQGYKNAFEVEQYGLFGMTFFIGMLTYLVVKHKAFNVKFIEVQALIVTLWFLVGSLVFVAQSTATRVIAGLTLCLTTLAGYHLIRSVKREIAQREEIEHLAQKLKKANERLQALDRMKSEFVSIASHQLRSPLTAIRGYASMLVEGSYGKVPKEALPVLKSVVDSSRYMAKSVEDYLNVSRIESGNMKYEMSDFSIKELATNSRNGLLIHHILVTSPWN